jgi:Asp-tRNA(Asn)/Glu-tRNA(Gln) amidotransferase A subunit family amidase
MDNLIIGATTKLNHLNIFSCFRPYHIRKQALESDNRWKLNKPLSIWDGVPVAIKDQSSVSGLKTCYGSSECIEWYDNDDDDIPSEYLKKAGAIIIGMVRTYVCLYYYFICHVFVSFYFLSSSYFTLLYNCK